MNLATIRGGLLTLIASSLVAVPTSAQSDTAEELRRLNRSVEQLVTLVGQLISQSETDLLLRRIELKQRKADPLEQELRQKLDQRDHALAAFDQQEQEAERLEQDIFDAESGGLTDSEDAKVRMLRLREQRRHQEDMLAEFERSYLQLEARIAELEAILAPLRAELATLDQELDERLLP